MSNAARLDPIGTSMIPPRVEGPDHQEPQGVYVAAATCGNLIFVSGQLPRIGGNLIYRGKVGDDVDLETAGYAAAICARNCCSVLAKELGGLKRVRRIVKLTVFVASAPGFDQQPRVADRASDVMIEVFGEAGRHARSAIGVAELPRGAPVEVELIAAIRLPARRSRVRGGSVES